MTTLTSPKTTPTTEGPVDYRRLFEEPPRSWNPQPSSSQNKLKRQIFAVSTTIFIVMVALLIPKVFTATSGSQYDASSHTMMRTQITSFSYNSTTKKFQIKGDVSLPKGTVMAYELKPQPTNPDTPNYYVARAAFVLSEDNKFTFSISTEGLPDAESYVLNVAFDPRWQNEGWPSSEILGAGQEKMTGPEIQTRNGNKQLVTQMILYTKQYF